MHMHKRHTAQYGGCCYDMHMRHTICLLIGHHDLIHSSCKVDQRQRLTGCSSIFVQHITCAPARTCCWFAPMRSRRQKELPWPWSRHRPRRHVPACGRRNSGAISRNPCGHRQCNRQLPKPPSSLSASPWSLSPSLLRRQLWLHPCP